MGRVNPDTIDLVDRISRYYGRRRPHDPEDLAQACWLDLLRYPESPAYFTARNAALHQCRRERRWRRHEDLEPRRPWSDGCRDEILDVPWYLDQLAPRQRQVIVLAFWHGLSNKEIAEHVGISWKVVAVTRANAMAKMRQAANESIE